MLRHRFGPGAVKTIPVAALAERGSEMIEQRHFVLSLAAMDVANHAGQPFFKLVSDPRATFPPWRASAPRIMIATGLAMR
jgi:hypothetical protein